MDAMTSTSALLTAALDPVLAGTAYNDSRVSDTRPGRSAYVLLCTATRTFRARHPDVLAPLDLEHPDGCMDLIIEVDEDGRLVRAELEMVDLAGDLLGQPIEGALPVLVERIAELLG